MGRYFKVATYPATVLPVTSGKARVRLFASRAGPVCIAAGMLLYGSSLQVFASTPVRPIGGRTQISVPEGPYGSGQVALLQLPQGRILVSWSQRRPTLDETLASGIWARVLDTNLGALGGPFLVNRDVPPNGMWSDIYPAAARIQDGFVVTWQNNYRDGSYMGVFAQRFDANAEHVGTEFKVNTITYGHQGAPSAASTVDGGFVVVWDNLDFNGGSSDIALQRFDPAGLPVGPESIAPSNPAVPPILRLGCAVASRDEHIAVAWGETNLEDVGGADSDDVYARVLAPQATDAVRVNASTSGAQILGDVAVQSDGTFIVTWRDRFGTEWGDAFARIFTPDGVAASPAVRINADGTQVLNPPKIASSGEFPVAVAFHTSVNGGERVAIRAVLISSEAALIGGEIPVAEVTPGPECGPDGCVVVADVDDPDVEFLDGKSFVVAWDEKEQSSPAIVYAKKYEIGFLSPTCGDANESGFYEATDALRALHAALGLAQCLMCLCDVDGSGTIVASDALVLLQTAVGTGPTLSCAACPP